LLDNSSNRLLNNLGSGWLLWRSCLSLFGKV
jgi:hypothetical protein